MDDLVRYIQTIIEPTVAEFGRDRSSVRHGFIACVVVFHAVDYRAYPKPSAGLRQRWRRQSADFALVDRVAHAFKHVATPSPARPDLLAENVRSRPPALLGRMVLGVSIIGDAHGAVVAEGQTLFEVVRRTVDFLRQQN